jgi:trehalose-6-phosphate synthase
MDTCEGPHERGRFRRHKAPYDGDRFPVVFILSQFTGAARELEDAVLINPFSVEEGAEAIRLALTMSEEERQRRMQRLRAVVAANNVYRWAGDIMSTLLRFDFPCAM